MGILRHGNISVPLHPNWTDESSIVVAGKSADDFRPNIVISKHNIDAGKTLDDFVLKVKSDLATALQDFSLESEGIAKYGPWTGYRLTYTFNVQNKVLKQMQFYIIQKSELYGFTFTNTVGNFDVAKQEAELILAQIMIK